MLPDRDSKKDAKTEENWKRGLGLLSVITADLLGYSGAGIALGYWLWKKVGLPWWVLLLFSMVGLGLAFYRLYEVSKKDWNG